MHDQAPDSDLVKSANPVTPKGDIERRKFIRKIVSLIVLVSAVVITLYVWGIIERHPRTDRARQCGGHCAACEWSNPQAECAG